MEIVYLGVVFLAIVLLLGLKRPLYQAIAGGLVAIVMLYGIPPIEWLLRPWRVLTHWDSLSVSLSLYLITYLQRMLEARGLLKLVQQDLNGLFHNRRVNAAGMPAFIGLLPSAAAMILCGEIVRDAAGDYLKPKEQAFVASWFRHIPESTLPTYSSVLLMSSLSGIPLPPFILGMIVPLIALVALGYFPYLRRLPKDPGTPRSGNRGRDAMGLLLHLWPLILVLTLILAFRLSVVVAVLATIAATAAAYRFRGTELASVLRSAFELKLLGNTFLVLVLKEFIAYTGVLQLLPQTLSSLPIPTFLIFALLFFIGGVISGSNGIIALGTPLAFAAIPGGGMPLMVLLMCMCHAANLVSPTHVCLVVAADFFRITLGELIRKTLPVSLLFCVSMIGY